MRAKFTMAALANYFSMVDKYGDIYLNEYGQVSRSRDSHETKYQDEKRKVPARSCMYAHLSKSNFPKTVEELEEMFIKQTLQRDGKVRQDKEAKKLGRNPEVVKADEAAFEKFLNGEKGNAPVETEDMPKKPMGRPKKNE